jgi:dolichyl-phosphate beta-glucosyltransferase
MDQTHIPRSIIIPAYSEASCIAGSLKTVHAFLIEQGWLDTTEVIVVTADAKDGTVEIVNKEIKQFPVHQHVTPGPRVGKGRDVKSGMRAARGELVVFTDADLATPIYHVIDAFKHLKEKGGMVIGIRNLRKIHNSILRRVSSVLSNLLVRSVIGWDIADSQCGFKGFTGPVSKMIVGFSEVDNWGFDFEFIKIAKLNDIHITTLPINDWMDPKAKSENLTGDSQWSAMKKTFKELQLVRVNSRKGRYEANTK